MAKRSRKRLLRSPAVLFVAFVTILGFSGLVFAVWSTYLTTEGNVNTGGLGVGWYEVGTDDDGNVVNDLSGSDNNTGQDFDMNAERSSADPSTHGPGAVDRWNKDVGACYAEGGGPNLNINLDNVYPGYNCTVYAKVRNEGSVPVKAAALDLRVQKVTCGEPATFWLDEEQNNQYTGGASVLRDEAGPFADNDVSGHRNSGDTRLWEGCTENVRNITPFLIFGGVEQPFGIASRRNGPTELTADIAQGIRCGTQLDPWIDESGGEFFTTAGWIRVEEPAMQNVSYRWTLTQQFVNWNEWNPDMCSPGAIIVDADGDPLP